MGQLLKPKIISYHFSDFALFFVFELYLQKFQGKSARHIHRRKTKVRFYASQHFLRVDYFFRTVKTVFHYTFDRAVRQIHNFHLWCRTSWNNSYVPILIWLNKKKHTQWEKMILRVHCTNAFQRLQPFGNINMQNQMCILNFFYGITYWSVHNISTFHKININESTARQTKA